MSEWIDDGYDSSEYGYAEDLDPVGYAVGPDPDHGVFEVIGEVVGGAAGAVVGAYAGMIAGGPIGAGVGGTVGLVEGHDLGGDAGEWLDEQFD